MYIDIFPNLTSLTYLDELGNQNIKLNNTEIQITRRQNLRLTCGTTQVGMHDRVTFSWYFNMLQLGPIITLDHSSYYAPGQYNITLGSDRKSVILDVPTTTTCNFFGEYMCAIMTPAQTVFIQGRLSPIVDYQVDIIGDYTIIEGNTLSLQCQVTYTLGTASSSESFTWYRSNSLISSG